MPRKPETPAATAARQSRWAARRNAKAEDADKFRVALVKVRFAETVEEARAIADAALKKGAIP